MPDPDTPLPGMFKMEEEGAPECPPEIVAGTVKGLADAKALLENNGYVVVPRDRVRTLHSSRICDTQNQMAYGDVYVQRNMESLVAEMLRGLKDVVQARRTDKPDGSFKLEARITVIDEIAL